MKLIDTHCHLNAEVFATNWQATLTAANQQGVSQCFVVGWDEASSRQAVKLALLDQRIKAIIGLHPVDIKAESDVSWLTSLYKENRDAVIAIGEIGLDYYWQKEPEAHLLQAKYLITQIAIANELNLPIVIHCRDAYDAILPILETYRVKAGGVMHCYGGPSHLVKAFVRLGFYLSYGGPITFKNAHEARESVKQTPLDRLLIETDSPYLSPHPLRGKPNSPVNLPLVFSTLQSVTQAPNLEALLITNTEKAFHVKTL